MVILRLARGNQFIIIEIKFWLMNITEVDIDQDSGTDRNRKRGEFIMPQPGKKRVTSEEYFTLEESAEYKSEYFHNEAGSWSLDEFKSLDDTLKINSIDIELPLNTIYYRVKL